MRYFLLLGICILAFGKVWASAVPCQPQKEQVRVRPKQPLKNVFTHFRDKIKKQLKRSKRKRPKDDGRRPYLPFVFLLLGIAFLGLMLVAIGLTFGLYYVQVAGFCCIGILGVAVILLYVQVLTKKKEPKETSETPN